MVKAGETAYLYPEIVDSGGDGLRYADASAFESAGGSVYYENGGTESALTYTLAPVPEADAWADTTVYAVGDRVIPSAPSTFFYVCTTGGTSAGSEPTWGTTVDGTTADGTVVWTCKRVRGIHELTFTAEAGRSLVVLRPVADTYSMPDIWTSDIQSYDADGIASLLLTSVSSPGVLTGADTDLGVITAGDAYRSTSLDIPAADATQAYGTTDLTGYLITAAAKFDPTDSADIDLTCTWISEVDRTFRISWASMPAAMITGLGDNDAVTIYIDVQVTKSGGTEPWTFRKFTASLVWDRNDN